MMANKPAYVVRLIAVPSARSQPVGYTLPAYNWSEPRGTAMSVSLTTVVLAAAAVALMMKFVYVPTKFGSANVVPGTAPGPYVVPIAVKRSG